MKNLILAIQFITILSFGKTDEFEPHKMIPFFPFVGLFLGVLLVIFDSIFLFLWPKEVAAILDVVFLVIVTGAFHLDGLGDSADGLLGHRPKEKVLLIMKDSRIGVMGLVAIVCGLAIKWGGIYSLKELSDFNRVLILLLIPAYARSGTLFGIKYLKYGRGQEGTGHDLFNEPLTFKSFWGVLIIIIISLFLGKLCIFLNLFFVFITLGLLFYYKKRLGCITGDMLGAMTEITESLMFLLITIPL